ncbi:MAG: N-acetyltransferase [Anaerovibrio sp.]|uniref:N-acetyltransferase n=1 Tax=Anaerovibrio sp. TaxID=1872532 RepID=UPI0025E46E90|nr:N-acetyltransferase [Anaerovibrio sp.]MCR5175540.1 N-acetyltransferase [Anaerovibrio sp.]
MIYRKPNFGDIESIFELVNSYANDGVMLARSRNTLYETIRDMIVAEDENGNIVGVGGLHVIWNELAEIRTMAVSQDHTRQGIGAEIVHRLLDEGRAIGVKRFITLTYKPGFFQTIGFRTITKEQLPHKVWKECIDCPKFPNCDEIAMTLEEPL